MAYTVEAVTVRTDNSEEGLKKIAELWGDVTSGKLPLLFDSTHHIQEGISPISRYSGYAGDETGAYDLTILGVTAKFFEELEKSVSDGSYQKYEASDAGGDMGLCAKMAWGKAWSDQQSGKISRAFTSDYESTVPPAYSGDGKAHCCLYIALR